MNYFTTRVTGTSKHLSGDTYKFRGEILAFCREIALRRIHMCIGRFRDPLESLTNLRTQIHVNQKKHLPFGLFEEIMQYTGVAIHVEEEEDAFTKTKLPWITLEGGDERHYPAWYWVVLACRFMKKEQPLGMLQAMEQSPLHRWDRSVDKRHSITLWKKLTEENYSVTSFQMVQSTNCPIDYYLYNDRGEL